MHPDHMIRPSGRRPRCCAGVPGGETEYGLRLPIASAIGEQINGFLSLPPRRCCDARSSDRVKAGSGVACDAFLQFADQTVDADALDHAAEFRALGDQQADTFHHQIDHIEASLA